MAKSVWQGVLGREEGRKKEREEGTREERKEKKGRSQHKRIEKYYITKDQYSFMGASLVAQWLRLCLPMQGTRV